MKNISVLLTKKEALCFDDIKDILIILNKNLTFANYKCSLSLHKILPSILCFIYYSFLLFELFVKNSRWGGGGGGLDFLQNGVSAVVSK